MGEAQQSPDRNNDLRARRTPSKAVSDAFSFLGNKSYPDRDGVVRIHSSYSEPRLAYMDLPENLQKDVYIPEDTDEFTIITSVQKSPRSERNPLPDGGDAYIPNTGNSGTVLNHNKNSISERRESLPTMHLSETCIISSELQNQKNPSVAINDHNNKIIKSSDKDEYRIVTYLEDFNKRSNNISPADSNKSQAQKTDMSSVDMTKDGSRLDVPKAVSTVDNDDNTGDTREKRKSVTVDGEVVELRSPDRNTKPARAPTWKQNQMLVSEAFDFLHDFEGGDTMSVINIPVEDTNANIRDRNKMAEKSDNQTVGLNINAKDLNINHMIQTVHHDSDKTSRNLNSSTKSTNLSSSGKSLSPAGENRVLNGMNSFPNSPERFSTTSEIDDQLGELGTSRLRQRKRSPKKDSDDDEDGDSSDEDRGVYRESFRKSTWLYVGDSSDVSSKAGSSKESGYISLADLSIKTCDDDSVFGEDHDSLPSESPTGKKSHERSDSVATTVSEREFRNAYSHVSKRVVKRADSELEYKRFSSKFYGPNGTDLKHLSKLKSEKYHEKVFTIEKDSSSGYGIHIIDSHPAVITQVDEDSPGARAGVKEGQIVISINNVNVLEHDHDDIIKLVQENSTKLVLEVGCSDVAHIRDLEMPIMTGYLMKQTSAMIFKTWKRRYFILRRDNCLYYYKTEKDSDPLGAIPLTGYTVSRHGDLNKFGFKAEKFDNRTYFFMADTRDDMAKWVGAMNEAALRSKHKKDTWLDVTTNNVGLPALEIRKPDCSGYLYKMGRVTKRWKRHYCVLKDACIYHYKSSSSKEAIGVAHLHGYTVDPSGLPGRKLSFCLQPPDPQMRSFSFYSDNETDKIRWVEALQKSIQKWVKVG